MVYKQAKEAYIKQMAEFYKENIPKRLYEAMYNYKVEITDQKVNMLINSSELIELLSDEDIKKIIITMGGQYKIENNESIIFSSICHHSDSYKLYYYKKYGVQNLDIIKYKSAP